MTGNTTRVTGDHAALLADREPGRRRVEAEPYAAVLAIHPRYVIDEQEGTLTELAESDESTVLDDAPHLSTMTDNDESDERA